MIEYTLKTMLLYGVIILHGWRQTRLGNPEVRRIVEQAVQELVTEYLEQHPNTLEAILSKALQAFRVRNDPLSNRPFLYSHTSVRLYFMLVFVFDIFPSLRNAPNLNFKIRILNRFVGWVHKYFDCRQPWLQRKQGSW